MKEQPIERRLFLANGRSVSGKALERLERKRQKEDDEDDAFRALFDGEDMDEPTEE